MDLYSQAPICKRLPPNVSIHANLCSLQVVRYCSITESAPLLDDDENLVNCRKSNKDVR